MWDQQHTKITMNLLLNVGFSDLNVSLSIRFSFITPAAIPATSVSHCCQNNDKHTVTADPKPTAHEALDILLLKHLWIYFFRPRVPREPLAPRDYGRICDSSRAIPTNFTGTVLLACVWSKTRSSVDGG